MVVKKILSWISRNRFEAFLLAVILVTALFLRVYKIDQYMTFLGDEGRDALMIKRILTTGDIPLIGPPTSIGNMYLGPLYYYMMTVPMAIFWLNPVAAAVMVAIIAVLCVLLIYYLAREWFGWRAAFLSAFLFAISPVLIIYSRSSWNPNPAPFFSLLAVASFYWMRKYQSNRFLILAAVSLAFLIQMHYLALIMAGIIGVLWIYELFRNWNGKSDFLVNSAIAVAIFCLLMSPLLIFDLRHGFMNFNAITTFFTNRQETVNLNSLNALERMWPIFFDKYMFRYIGGQNIPITLLLSLLIIGMSLFFLYKALKSKGMNIMKGEWPNFALFVWFVIGITGVSLYKQNIYDHYLLFMAPIPFLLLAALVSHFNSRIQTIAVIILVVTLGIVNLQVNPFKQPPNNQLVRTQDVAKHIIAKSEGKPFNFALLSKHNYDSAYQFYLDLYGHKPKVVPDEVTDQLFVVCEDPICEPINNAKYEIAAFGWVRVESEEDFRGVKVFKLVANKVGNNTLAR